MVRGNPQSGTIASGTTAFGANGTLGGSSYTGPANWFTPTAFDVGQGYYLRLTKLGGVANFSQTAGIWINIALTLNVTASGAVGSCNGTWEISPKSTGTPVVCSGTISVNNTI